MGMPVLPLYVHQGLGLGTFLVGLVTGSQFAAAILSRVWAGRQSDTRGPKIAVIAGLAIAAASGGVYLLLPHGVELNGEQLFYEHVKLHGGPAPVRRYLPESH
jgi:MFS family permease